MHELHQMSVSTPTPSGNGIGHKQDIICQLFRGSSVLPEPIWKKYPALLEVPFISETELLLTRQVGSGSFGLVYHGILFSQDVAVKRLTVRNFTDELDFFEMEETGEADQKARQVAKTLHALEKEVSIMKGLRFGKIVQFYGVCLKPAAIVTQYCSRGSLFDLIGNARSIVQIARELTWKRRLQLAMDAAIGMNYLHSRMDPVLHRDLKSPNLLVDEYFNCKVADFNTSCFIDQTIITDSIQANNPRWMAPEVAAGSPFTKAADVYPFGIILWELMTWKEPFESDHDTMRPIPLLIITVKDGHRPEIIPNDKLLGGPCPVYDDYLKLMKDCWHQNPEMRPSFQEIIDRLKELMTVVVQCTESASIHQSGRKLSEQMSSKKLPKPTSYMPPKIEDHDAETHLATGVESMTSYSPFMHGPSLSDAGEESTEVKSQQLENAESSSVQWSDQIEDKSNSGSSQTGGMSRAAQWWRKLSSEHFHITPTGALQHQLSNGMAHWDSLRTLIFGERESDRFVEKFSNFVLGDETELTKNITTAFNQTKIPVGLKVIKEMMKLKEQEQQQKKRDHWSIVKHLMLENLKPSVRHPLWKLLAKNLNNAQTHIEAMKPIQDNKDSTPLKVHRLTTTRGRKLWKKVQLAFNLEDYTPTKPLKSPYWHVLRSMLFKEDDDDEVDVPPTIPEDSSEASTSQGTRVENLRAKENWRKVKRAMDLEQISFWERNKQFLEKFAKEQHPEINQETPQVHEHSRQKSRGWERVRKLLIVDEKPPSEDKWQFVREYLLDNDFGCDWHKLSAFAKTHAQPPSGGHWEQFRRLFFENRNLREQSQWSFLKDLFLKQDD